MAQKQTEIKGMTYEQAFAELETVVEQLENGQLPLEQALTLYERGQQLAQFCGSLLDQAELKIRQLNPAGKPAAEEGE
jgi:exodeoxyribonuclease VII small subunit